MDLQILFLQKIERKLNSVAFYMTFLLGVSFNFFKRRSDLYSLNIFKIFHFIVRITAKYITINLCISFCYSFKPAPIVICIKLLSHRQLYMKMFLNQTTSKISNLFRVMKIICIILFVIYICFVILNKYRDL